MSSSGEELWLTSEEFDVLATTGVGFFEKTFTFGTGLHKQEIIAVHRNVSMEQENSELGNEPKFEVEVVAFHPEGELPWSKRPGNYKAWVMLRKVLSLSP